MRAVGALPPYFVVSLRLTSFIYIYIYKLYLLYQLVVTKDGNRGGGGSALPRLGRTHRVLPNFFSNYNYVRKKHTLYPFF
jgi:hypothetical protein